MDERSIRNAKNMYKIQVKGCFFFLCKKKKEVSGSYSERTGREENCGFMSQSSSSLEQRDVSKFRTVSVSAPGKVTFCIPKHLHF